MNFYAADGTLSPYWVKHFEALGIDIPQGEPGTNPVEMSKDPHITPIHYYGERRSNSVPGCYAVIIE